MFFEFGKDNAFWNTPCKTNAVVKSRIPARAILLSLILLGQGILYGVLWSQSDPITSDFPYFYNVARLYEFGRNPYDLKAQCEAEASMRQGDCAGYAHTPILLPLMGLLFDENFYASYWRWSAFQIVLVLASAWCLYLISGNIFGSIQCILFAPVIGAMMIGNDTTFILTSLLGSAVLLLRQQDLWAGLCLSLTVLKPHIALPLAIALLFVRPKAFLGFLVGGFVLAAYSFAIVGREGFIGIIEITRSLSAGSTFGGVSQAIMFNTTGLLARAGVSIVWAWPIYVVGIVGLSYYLAQRGVNKRSLSFAIVVAVFICPHLFFYDLSYLVLPLIVGHPLGAMTGSLIAGLVWLGLPWWCIYIMMAALAYILFEKRKRHVETTSKSPERD